MEELWVKVPERGKSVHALAVALQSLVNQLNKLPRGTDYDKMKLDNDTRSVRVTIAEVQGNEA